MSFSSLLDHSVSIVRQVGDLDVDSAQEYDVYNQPVTSPSTTAGVPAAIQPFDARGARGEAERVSQAGAVLADYTIFLNLRDITTADAVLHDPDACTKPADRDLPLGLYQIINVRNPTGRGHHHSLDAKLVEAPTFTAPTSTPEPEPTFTFTTEP